MPTYLKPHNPSLPQFNDINCQQILSHIQSCPVCQLLWRAPGGHDFALPKLSSKSIEISPAVAILILIIIVLIIMYVVKQ